MGKNSHIEWTHHTFNPWWGCAKVSPACENCYAEAWAKRVGDEVWGARAARRFFGEAHWREPLKWQAEAAAEGIRARVFCASMADIFEARSDLNAPRENLWKLIVDTPNLDWLLLTKRPENIHGMVPWANNWPMNVWLGTSVESQSYAMQRIPYLLSCAARIRFLSCEPLLGPLDFSRWINTGIPSPIHWVIAGGESGPKSRPMDPEWVRSLRDFCHGNSVAFHFKQWGHWAPTDDFSVPKAKIVQIGRHTMVALGKWISGRTLDGEIYDEFPEVAG